MAGSVTLNRTCTYRREARRIRGRLAEKPIARYLALRELSHRHDAESNSEHLLSTGGNSPATAFAQLASQQLRGQVLCYSKRLGLLRAARRLGIGRFEANLIIAALQHRQASSTTRFQPIQRRSRFPVVPVLTVVVVQSLILVSLWGIFLR